MATEPMFSPVAPEAIYIPETPIAEVVAEVNATTETPAVVPETPAAEAPIEAPVAEVPAEGPPTTVEVIKEVEKIVEKYPEMDEYTSEIFTAILEGKEDVLLNYLSEKNRDYTKMSDYDVVKASLRKTNPHYSDEDAALKIEMQYGDVVKVDLSGMETDSEEYAEALHHNKTVERNLKMLKLDASDARNALETAKKEVKLPRIQQQAVTDNAPTPEAIEQGRKDWHEYVDKNIPEVKDFTYKVGDEDVSYKVSDAERTEMSTLLKESDGNKILQELGWIDKDGKQNVSRIAGDVLKLKKMSTLVSNAYTQGKTAGTKSTVAEIKNIDLSANNSQGVATQPADIGLLGFAHLNPK